MRRNTTVTNFQELLKNSASAGVVATSLALAAAGAAAAQTTDSQAPVEVTGDRVDGDTRDVIVVTGRRRDAQLAIEAKRNADQVIDVLSADQASQLPDNNLAESLGRIPGVSFQRSGETGNGNFISIRGLDSALNNIQFNGVNSGLASGGNRRVPLDGITSDDIAEIRVAKSLLPQDEGEGIGGAVNVIARTPLLRGEDRFTFDAEGRYGEFADRMGYRVGGSATKVWGDRFGVNIAASFRRRHLHNFELDASSSNIFALPEIRDADGNVVAPSEILALGLEDAGSAFDNVFEGLIPDTAITFEEQSYQLQQQVRDTLTISGAIDWRPVESTLLTLGGRLSRRETDATEFSITFDDDDRDFQLIDGQLVTEFGDPEIDVEAQLEDQFDLNANAFLKGVTELDRLTLEYQLSYARAVDRSPQTDIEFNSGSLLDEDSVNFQRYSFVNTYFPIPNLSVLDDADFVGAIADIPGTQEFSGFESDLINQRENDRYAARVDAEYELGLEAFGGVFNTVRVGGKFERSDIREDFVELTDDAGDLNIDGTFNADGDGTAEDALLSAFPDLFGGFESLAPIDSPLDPIGLGGIPTLNEGAMRALVGRFQDSFLAAGADPGQVTFFDAREDVFAGYFQTEFEIGKLKLVGGVRVERYDGEFASPLELDADLVTVNGGVTEVIDLGPGATLETIETSSGNTEILPRFNALYRVNDEFQVRAGFGYSIARPTFEQLGTATEIDIFLQADADDLGAGPILPGVDNVADALAAGGIALDQLTEADITIESGNPNLENARSLNADLSLEYFPVAGTALTVGLFYKRINNFIFVGQESGSGSIEAGLAEGLLSADAQALLANIGGLDAIIASGVSGDFEVLIPQNGDVATVRGVELGVFHEFSWAPGFLSDVGFFGNVTFTDTDAEYQVVAPATIANPEGGLEDDEALVALGFAEVGDGLVRRTSFFNSPKISANGSVYYEANGLEVALSASYQSRQFDFTDDFGLDQFNGSFYQMDIFVGYDLPIDERYGRYQLYVEVPDVTDNGLKPTDLQTVGRGRNAFDEASFNGREVSFGIRGRF